MKNRIRLRIRAVIFDMDGVITNTMPDHFKAWKKTLLSVGIPVSFYDVYSREGQQGLPSLRGIFESHKRTATDAQLKDLVRKKEALFKKIVKTRFIPGARSFIKFLKRNHFKLALVTGTSRHELHKILPDDIYTLFDVIITGTDVKKGKPDPEPYRAALKQLKLKQKDAVVLENAPSGIQSAKAAGLKCLAIETSLPKTYLRQADNIFPSIRELRDKIHFILKA
jgi:beta-phosphoglucomutase